MPPFPLILFSLEATKTAYDKVTYDHHFVQSCGQVSVWILARQWHLVLWITPFLKHWLPLSSRFLPLCKWTLFLVSFFPQLLLLVSPEFSPWTSSCFYLSLLPRGSHFISLKFTSQPNPMYSRLT